MSEAAAHTSGVGTPSLFSTSLMPRTTLVSALVLSMALVASLLSAQEANFGRALAMTETELFVGQPLNWYGPGAVYTYRLDAAGRWQEQARLTASDTLRMDSFGQTLALDGNTLLIGSWPYGESKAKRIKAWQISDDNTFTLAGRVRAPAFTSLGALNGLLVGYGNGLPWVFDVSDPANLRSLDDADILSNCRQYPRDEAPGAYKDFEEVLTSVKKAGLASEVARLRARFVIKDGDKADD